MHAGQQVGIAEGKPRGTHDRILADGDDGEPDDRRQQSLDPGPGRERADDGETEKYQAEEVRRAELQRQVGQPRCDEEQAKCAEEPAAETRRNRHAQRASGLAARHQRVAVQRRCRGGRRTGNVQQDGGKAAAQHAPGIEPQKEADGDVGVEHERQRQDDDHRRGDRHAGNHAGDDAEQASHARRSQACRLNRLEQALQQVARHHHVPRGRSTWNPVLNTM